MSKGQNQQLINMGEKQTGEPDRGSWRTPPNIIKMVKSLYSQDCFDPFPPNFKKDAFSYNWFEKSSYVYVNPPFSMYRKVALYALDLPRTEHDNCIFICNHNHNTKWWHKLYQNASAICMLHDRVHFINPVTNIPAEHGAPGTCQDLIYWGCYQDEFIEIFNQIGHCVDLGWQALKE